MSQTGLPAEVLGVVRHVFEEKIPFNRLLGLKLGSLDPERPEIGFELRPELVGNFTRGALHGGVIGTVLDSVGGLAALLGALRDHAGEPEGEILRRLGRISTIDLRIDYLRPSNGRSFLATGFVLRAGGTLTVARMELHDSEQTLVAVGIGTYRLS